MLVTLWLLVVVVVLVVVAVLVVTKQVRHLLTQRSRMPLLLVEVVQELALLLQMEQMVLILFFQP
jgi:hypothetical protein